MDSERDGVPPGLMASRQAAGAVIACITINEVARRLARPERGPMGIRRTWMSVPPRDRLRRLVDLARVYRRWSRQQIAEALGREASKVVPESGNPKLDLVMALSEAMNWEPGHVAQCVWHGHEAPDDPATAARSLEELETEAALAEHAGQWLRLERLARAMRSRAQGGASRAMALHLSALACAGDGRFAETLRHAQAGLREMQVPARTQLLLMRDLACAHDALGHLVESGAVATQMIARIGTSAHVPELRECQACAFWIRGNSSRRRIDTDSALAPQHAADASADLHAAMRAYEGMARESSSLSAGAMAHRCAGALVECETVLGALSPEDGVRRIEAMLGAVIDVDEYPAGEWLESHGWWAIFGCMIAMRSMSGAPLQRAMAVFTNKAAEIAERVDSWSLRERAFSLEHLRRGRASDEAGIEPEWLLDRDEMRMVAGAVGRFPAFREVGMDILASARLLEPA